MRIYPPDSATLRAWKSTPLRVNGPGRSSCCSWPTVLAQSMQGGYVTANCTKCGRKNTLSNADFLNRVELNVACPECGQRMYRDFIDKNYGLICCECQTGIRLADILPHWSQIVASALLGRL